MGCQKLLDPDVYVDVPSGLLSLDGRSLFLIEPDPRLNLNFVGDRYLIFNSSQIKGSTGSNDARMMTLSSTHVD